MRLRNHEENDADALAVNLMSALRIEGKMLPPWAFVER